MLHQFESNALSEGHSVCVSILYQDFYVTWDKLQLYAIRLTCIDFGVICISQVNKKGRAIADKPIA